MCSCLLGSKGGQEPDDVPLAFPSTYRFAECVRVCLICHSNDVRLAEQEMSYLFYRGGDRGLQRMTSCFGQIGRASCRERV